MKKSDYVEKSNQRAAAILCVLILLAMVATCHSQVIPMKFACGLKDTIYVGVTDDKFEGTYLTVSCSKHNHTEWKSITLGFIDGTFLDVYSDNEWWVLDKDKLASMPFDYISFNEEIMYVSCEKIKTKDYFIKYFNK